MASAIRNADQTFTVTLSAIEQRIVTRASQTASVPAAAVMAQLIEEHLRALYNGYRRLDGDSMQERYDALTPAQQAQIDAILGGG